MQTAVAEAQARASDEVAHRARHQRLAGFGHRGDARGDMHGNAADIVAFQLDLAGVESAAHADPKRLHHFGYRRGAAHGAGGAVEGGEKPVAEVFHFMPAKPRELLAHGFVMSIEQRAPLAVARSEEHTSELQ